MFWVIVKAAAAGGTLNKIGVEDIDVAGKRVLMRVDFNVPMDGKRITNTQVTCCRFQYCLLIPSTHK